MATTPDNGEVRESVRQIVTAFGLDPKKVREICIRFAVDDLVMVSAVLFAEPDGIMKLGHFIKKYRLVPVEDRAEKGEG